MELNSQAKESSPNYKATCESLRDQINYMNKDLNEYSYTIHALIKCVANETSQAENYKRELYISDNMKNKYSDTLRKIRHILLTESKITASTKNKILSLLEDNNI